MGGRSVVVTGGGSGIGAATAAAFARLGDAVVVADRDEAAAVRVAERITAAGGQALAVAVDVSTADGACAMVEAALDAHGGLHVACNNAGVSGPMAPVVDLAVDEWDRTLAVNLTSVLLCLQAELPAIEASGGGAVVNVASVAGLIGVPNLAAYSASKHGVVGLTRSAALEWARRGIRVNAVCPGTVRTPMLRAHVGGDEEALEAAGRHGSPMGRLADPDEIADAVVWLCSEGAGYVTGHALAVDGGAAAT